MSTVRTRLIKMAAAAYGQIADPVSSATETPTVTGQATDLEPVSRARRHKSFPWRDDDKNPPTVAPPVRSAAARLFSANAPTPVADNRELAENRELFRK